jgi:hypothetical protein
MNLKLPQAQTGFRSSKQGVIQVGKRDLSPPQASQGSKWLQKLKAGSFQVGEEGLVPAFT